MSIIASSITYSRLLIAKRITWDQRFFGTEHQVYDPFSERIWDINFAAACGKITGAGLACRYSLWGHPEKYLVELGSVFSFVGFKPEYAGKLNYYCSTDANALTQIPRKHCVIFIL